MVAQLKAAAAEAHAWLMDKSATDVTPWWPDSQWCVPTPPITVPTDFKWETPNYFGVDARGIARSQYFCPTAKLGTGSFCFGTFHDHAGKPLEGQTTYRLHVPANVPVREFRSATVYSLKRPASFSTRSVSPSDRWTRTCGNSEYGHGVIDPRCPQMPETTRSRVLAKVYGQSLDLRSAAAQLGLSVADLNEEFGVRPLDAERSLYAVLVCSESLPAGPFSDPKIAPFGPARKITKG